MTKRIAAALAALCVILCFMPVVLAEETGDDVLPKEFTQAFTYGSEAFNDSAARYFSSVLLFCPDSGDVIYSKDADTVFSCSGSVAMLMTTQLAMRHLSLSERVTISSEMTGPYSKKIGLVEGTQVRVCELIAAMLLCEAQDAAAALGCAVVTQVSGADVSDKLLIMTALMNDEANRLGMNNTNYGNAVGNYSSSQTSTATDTARLMYAIYTQADDGALVGNTDYLRGCLAQGGFEVGDNSADPRNKACAAYSTDICGYAVNVRNGVNVMAFAKLVDWKTSSTKNPTLSGQVFFIGITNQSGQAANAVKLLDNASDGYALLYYTTMCRTMMSNTNCPYCNGTVSEHSSICTLGVETLDLDDDTKLKLVSETTFALMTELYGNNSFSKFSLSYDGEAYPTGEDGRVVGDPVIDITVYFDGQPLMSETLYASSLYASAQTDDLVYTTTEPSAEDEDSGGLKWQVILLFAIGIPLVVVAIAWTIVVRNRVRKF